MRRRISRMLMMVAIAAAFGLAATSAIAYTLPPIKHVFIIVLENESASTTFGPDSKAPYLSTTLRAEGAYLPNYYGTGHDSNDNYISMISGQPPNLLNQTDCQTFGNFPTDATGSYGAQIGDGCVYPSNIQNIATQLDAAGDTWRDYNEEMGNTPAREAAECGHPAVGTKDGTETATAADMYATRHNPFVYFHSIIDNTTLCDSHVVNLDQLPQNLATASDTANYTFITPDLCDDGHDSPCADGEPGGLTSANLFLEKWVPMITSSPAYKQDNGLLIITFDEASTSDTSDCCGEIPGSGSPEPGLTGAGGGDVGAVLLSPCIKPGTVSIVPYNHYSMLGSVEDIFGLSHLGYAQLPGEVQFGSDIFTGPCSPAPKVSVTAPPISSTSARTTNVPVRWRSPTAGATFEVQIRTTSGVKASAWRTLEASTTTTRLTFKAKAGQTYQLRVKATGGAGQSPFATTTVVVPTPAKPAGLKLTGSWALTAEKNEWLGHALVGSGAGAAYTFSYTGGALAIIGGRWRLGGSDRVTFDGRTTRIDVHASSRLTRQVLYRNKARSGRHTLTITVESGSIPIEGLAITNLR